MGGLPPLSADSLPVFCGTTYSDDSESAGRLWAGSSHCYVCEELSLCLRTVNSTADPRCGLREWPVLPLRGGTYFLAHAAFPSLRAHAAQNTDSQIGLFPAIRCDLHQGPVLPVALGSL